MNARETILDKLAKIRAQDDTAEAASPETGGYIRQSPLLQDAQLERFLSRIADYGVPVHLLTGEDEIAAAATAQIANAGCTSLVVPRDLPAAWWPNRVAVTPDNPPLSHAALDRTGGVMTGAALAIAETGTIVLDSGPSQGRRALSLLADYHLCVLFADQLVGSVPEALQTLRAHAERPLTFISGPSATADIEFDRVVGVHGPRRLELLLVKTP